MLSLRICFHVNNWWKWDSDLGHHFVIIMTHNLKKLFSCGLKVDPQGNIYTHPLKHRLNVYELSMEGSSSSASPDHCFPYRFQCSALRLHLQCRRHKQTWVRFLDRKSPWRRKWQPAPVILPKKSHGQRSLAGYSSWGHKSQTRLSSCAAAAAAAAASRFKQGTVQLEKSHCRI